MKQFTCTCIALLLLACLPASAQVSFTASASASRMGLDDLIQVEYTITNVRDLTGLGPKGNNFGSFRQLGPPATQQSTVIEFQGSRPVPTATISFIYTLQPSRTGRLSIPPGLATDAAGNRYESNSLSIEVVPGSLDPRAQARGRQQGHPQSGPAPAAPDANLKNNVFLSVVTDRQQAYVGEQVTATYKLYTRLPMQMSISRLPMLNGFWTHDFRLPAEPRPREERYNGQMYQVFTLKQSALFPQQSGSLTLDPAEVSGTVRIPRQVQRRHPFADMLENDPIFQRFFGGSLSMSDPFFDDNLFGDISYEDVQAKLESEPVQIQVLPLPEAGKPASFGGAVGRFTLTDSLSGASITTDEVATLQLIVSGSGNLKLISPPKLQLPDGLSALEPQITDSLNNRGTSISGFRSFSYTISPLRPGTYTIPAQEFSFFNPQTKAYVSLHSRPMTIRVAPGAQEAAMQQEASGGSEPSGSGLLLRWGAIGAGALLLIGGGWLLYSRMKRNGKKESPAAANRQALLAAHSRLAHARQLMQERSQTPFFEEVSRAVWLYLSHRLNIPLSALSQQEARNALQARNIPEPLQQKTFEVLEACELALYTPGGGGRMEAVYEQAAGIITELEPHLK